ncbi:hypothetical protein LMG26689_03493 [Achromobacter animicus]|uniref:SH3 domain-containing protein n=1 Tax=Achromobacter animicus TaxID=1389935 RepID=UPI001464FC78|nr:SH3 domain-containing protein [Achromobacter animicus]CAB3881144.1 hypothetical protein LMG26689_03493 [Achromobacter animicus]
MTPKKIAGMIQRLKRQLSRLGETEREIASLLNKPRARTSLEASEALYRTRMIFPSMTVELAEFIRSDEQNYAERPDWGPLDGAVKKSRSRTFTPEATELIQDLIRLTAAQVDIDNLAREYGKTQKQHEAVIRVADLVASEGAEPDRLERLVQHLAPYFKPEIVVALLIMIVQIVVPAYLDAQTDTKRAQQEDEFREGLLSVMKSLERPPGKATHYATRNLNLRSGPGREHEVIGRVVNGEMIELIEVEEMWARIIIQSGNRERIGWVYRPLLSPLNRMP